MNTATATDNGQTQTITTTLFDLMEALQQSAATPQEDALIVPTVAHWLRSGRLRFADDLTHRPAA
jgi:hypothetical protein